MKGCRKLDWTVLALAVIRGISDSFPTWITMERLPDSMISKKHWVISHHAWSLLVHFKKCFVFVDFAIFMRNEYLCNSLRNTSRYSWFLLKWSYWCFVMTWSSSVFLKLRKGRLGSLFFSFFFFFFFVFVILLNSVEPFWNSIGVLREKLFWRNWYGLRFFLNSLKSF